MAHRYITRPFNAGSENHIAPSEHEFFTRAEQHLFCSQLARQQYLLWHWRGDRPLAARRLDVVANGSRAHLALARERYGEVLVPICLAVSPPVLRQRLEQRGRENALEIAQRLERAARYKPDNCLTLNNDGSLRQSVDEFFRLLRRPRGARSGSTGIKQR
ncbi:ribose 1,5-bisphosphokinase [Klebsiella pneumoniae subsp. pneumoniae]|nr:ribose 1,5-bisphosphokinase [Klebsiella pneumoniae subsp. pneumoniae]